MWAATGPSSMGTVPSMASGSSRNPSREGGTGWIPSTADHSSPLGHYWLAQAKPTHICTHRGLSYQLPRDSHTLVCSITQFMLPAAHTAHTHTHTHTLCPSHSELTHPEVPPQGHPHSCSGIIVSVPQRLTRLGAQAVEGPTASSPKTANAPSGVWLC